MKIGRKLLKWWLIFCLTLLGFGTLYYFNMHSQLYYADVTKLSFLIIIILCLLQSGLEEKLMN